MTHRRRTVLLVTLTATLIAAGGQVRAQQPLGERAQQKLFWSSPEDPVPKKRRVNAHFWAGNERELYIFYRDLKDVGGGYLGVGSDQCYLLLGWMKARFAWCVDYDEKVVLVHLVHQAFFRAARTPKAFLSLWRRRQRKASARLLEQTFATDPRRKAILRVFRRARASVFTRLYRMSIHMRRALTPSYLNTQSQYDFVRKRVLARRVRPMLGNLLGSRALRSIGGVARRLAVPIRVLYLSNAEQYWRRYPTDYRKNIRSLHFGKRAVVLRTFGKSRKRNLYTYQRQSASGYLTYLRIPTFHRVYNINSHKVLRRRSVNFYVADPPRRRKRRHRRRRRKPRTR